MPTYRTISISETEHYRILPHDSIEGPRAMLESMADLIRSAIGAPVVRDVVEDLIARHGEAAPWAMHDLTLKTFVYRPDPEGIYLGNDERPEMEIFESTMTPETVLLRRLAGTTVEGDCDDYATFVGGLARTAGYPVRLVSVAANNKDGILDHVFCEVMIDGRWVASDGIHGDPFGWRLSDDRISAVLVVDV